MEYPIRTDRSSRFRQLIKPYAELLKVVEIKSDPDDTKGILLYILDVKPDNESIVTDYAFQTFIKNPAFQKYYE